MSFVDPLSFYEVAIDKIRENIGITKNLQLLNLGVAVRGIPCQLASQRPM